MFTACCTYDGAKNSELRCTPSTSSGGAEAAAAAQQLPQLNHWDDLSTTDRALVEHRLDSIVQAFARELLRGKIFMKLGKNGRLFYRLCTLDPQWSALAMHIKGSIVEFPFANMRHVAFGYDLSDFTHVPLSLPSDSLAAVIVMDEKRVNLVFSSPLERDEFVTCMLVLIERAKR